MKMVPFSDNDVDRRRDIFMELKNVRKYLREDA